MSPKPDPLRSQVLGGTKTMKTIFGILVLIATIIASHNDKHKADHAAFASYVIMSAVNGPQK